MVQGRYFIKKKTAKSKTYIPHLTEWVLRSKGQSYKGHIPVIFLTAKSDAQDIVKGFDVGGVDYVTKPFYSAELPARIKTHLELKILRGLFAHVFILQKNSG